MASPASIWLALNGAPPVQINVPDDTMPLLYVLRGPDYLGLKGPKFGCGFGQCGACSVYLLQFGQVARTCQIPIPRLFAYEAVYHASFGSSQSNPLAMLTLEGLGTAANPHPLQSAFVDQQAGQCAYCANSIIMGAYGFLKGRFRAGNTLVPTDDEVKQFLSNDTFTDPTVNPPKTTPSPYLCRCGAHLRFIRAIQEATPAMMTRFANGMI